MEINLEALLKYLNKLGATTIAIDMHNLNEPTLIIQRGLYDDFGSTRVHLLIEDFIQILEANKVIGENGQIKEILNSYEKQSQEKIDDCIYGTLSKYLNQMINASLGKNLYPEIVYLKKHKDYFWI